MSNEAVHAGHCCKWHGCKYGDKDCPVVTGKVDQLYPCDHCYDEMDEAEYYTSVVARLPQMFNMRLKAQKRTIDMLLQEKQKNGE